MKVVEFKHDFGPFSWAQVRNYTHAKPYNNGSAVGNGWRTRYLPRIVQTKDGYSMRFSTGEHVDYRYNESTGDFSGKKYHEEKLILDETKNEFLVQRKNGDTWFFNRTESEQYSEGSLKRIDGADGQAVLFVYENKRLTLIQGFEKASDASPTSTISFSYEANGLFSEIVLRLVDERKTLRNFIKIVYTHYDENEAHGNSGDLKTAVRYVSDGDTWQESGTWYYRYFKDGDTRGHRSGMKSAFLPQEFETLKTAKGNKFVSLTDEELSLFASFEFEYDAEERKTLERSARGTLTKTWSYETFTGSGGRNHVRTRTTEIRSDGKKIDVFKNKYGRVIFKEELDETVDGSEPIRALNVYDRGGNVLRKYLPGSIRSWHLADQSNGKKITIVAAQNEGQIVYNAFDSHARKARKIRQAIQNGTKGKSIPQGRWEYEAFDVAGKSVVKLRKRIVFADENSQNKIETAYHHELYGQSGKIQKKTTFLPVVSQLENGDGKQAQTVVIMDEYGRGVWSKDELGVMTHHVYDRSGRLIRRIADVDTTKTADFGTPLPEGWQTPAEAGKHDVTDFTYDYKGRLVKTVGPESEGIDDTNKLVSCRPVSWTVYDDIARTQRSASGYIELDDEGNTVKTVLVNPVSITIHDGDGNITDQIQASRKNLEGPLTEKDRFDQGSYISWTKNVYRFGKRVAMRQYHAIPECGEGVSGDCFAETTFDYDLQGRQVRTVSPSGAIHRTVYDAHGNAVQSWIGTNDVGATDMNPKSDDPANDMRLANETVYGRGEGNCVSCGGGVSDRVIAQVQYLEEGKSRVTEYKYDWRGRQVETLGDEDEKGNSLASVQYYDNLDRVVKTEQFLCREDKKTKRGQQRLVARTEMFLNVRGQAWKTEESIVAPQKGEVKRKVRSESWFDAAGRTVKQKQGGRRGYSISEYKPNGELKRAAQVSDSGEVLAESMPILDRRGRNVGGVQKNRRVKGKKQGRHVLPKEFGADQTSATRFTQQWFDPAGRNIAMGDYGFIETDAQPVSDYIPQSSETVRVSKTVYDPESGRVLGYIDSEGRETRSEVDAMGRTLKTIVNFKGCGVFNPEKPEENITTEMRYDIAGNLVWQRDPAGNVTQQVYDKLGRLMATIAPNGGRTQYGYDQVGQTIAVIDPMGRTTRFEYDSHGRRVKTILPKATPNQENPVQETVYNEIGQVEAQVDPLGNTTRIEYDEMGRTVRQIDANGGVTAFEYDDEGKLLSLIDPVGNMTRYEYDELGRVEKETNELGKSRLFEYTPSGALLEKTDRNGRVTAFKHTRFGQVAEERWLTGKRLVGRICFDYDHSGKLTRVSDSSGAFEYTHDVLGRPVVETVDLVGFKQRVTLQNTFDVLGRRTSQMALVGQREDYTNRWTYNNLGQVDEISHGGPSIEAKQAVYSYDKAGARTGVAVSSGENEVYRSEFVYDGMGRLEGIHYVNPAAETLAKYGLTWDTASRIVAMNLDGEPAKYGYDATSQLTSATYDKLPAEAYEYDANGNRKNFETGKNNQLTSDGEFRYTYDNEGNRLTKGKTRYFWDHRNRLVKVVTPKKTVEYQYDYRNRLTRRNDEFFVHDGWQIVCSLKNGKILDRYLWGAKQDELLCENDGVVLADHLGTIRKTIGKNAAELTYNAFGKLISSSGKLPRFRYTGKLFDDDTGLQWNVNRWYDANVGRWISEDPIGFEGGDSNISRYVKSAPINRNDANGLKYACIGATAGITGVMSAFITHASHATTLIPLYGMSFSFGWYFCYGYSSIHGGYCGSCVVLSITVAIPAAGFYFSLGAGPSIQFNPIDPTINRPDPGLGVAIGIGGGAVSPYTIGATPVIPEMTIDVSLPKGDITITVPRFGFAVGAYLAFRITGTCTGCTPTMLSELRSCWNNFNNQVNAAMLWARNYITLNGATGNPAVLNHTIFGNGPAYNPVLVEAGIVP